MDRINRKGIAIGVNTTNTRTPEEVITGLVPVSSPEKNLEFLRQEYRRHIIGTPKSILKKFEQQLPQEDWKAIHDGTEVASRKIGRLLGKYTPGSKLFEVNVLDKEEPPQPLRRPPRRPPKDPPRKAWPLPADENNSNRNEVETKTRKPNVFQLQAQAVGEARPAWQFVLVWRLIWGGEVL